MGSTGIFVFKMKVILKKMVTLVKILFRLYPSKKKDQGHYYIWNSHQFNRYRYKKTDCVEKYTISAVTTLDHDLPLIFTIITGYSNGPHYESFMIKEVLPILKRGDTIIVDNQNYHVKGTKEMSKVIIKLLL